MTPKRRDPFLRVGLMYNVKAGGYCKDCDIQFYMLLKIEHVNKMRNYNILSVYCPLCKKKITPEDYKDDND